jgi:hypothetical protein
MNKPTSPVSVQRMQMIGYRIMDLVAPTMADVMIQYADRDDHDVQDIQLEYECALALKKLFYDREMVIRMEMERDCVKRIMP